MTHGSPTWRKRNFRKSGKGWVLPFTLFLAILLGIPLLLQAEEIAILKSADISAYTEAIEGFKSHLPPSAHITLEYDLQGNMAKGRNLARRIRASAAKVVLAVGLKAALAAKLEILDIPVIFCLVLDPEKYGLPANNMVGLSLDIPFKDHVKPLKTLLPAASRLGILFDQQKTGGMVTQLTQAGTAQGFTIIAQEVSSERDIPKALQAFLANIDALWLLPDSTVLTESSLDVVMSWALQHNIPVVGFSAGLVKNGALVAAYLHYTDIGEQAASLASTLFQKPQSPLLGTSLMPMRIHQSVNQKTATFLGIPLPSPILRQFHEQF